MIDPARNRPGDRSFPRMLMAGVLAVLACSRAPASPPALRVETTPAGESTRLALVAAPGVRISAQLRPALELPDGTVLRFDGARLPSDSGYFSDPPTTLLAGHHDRVSGTLHASICLESERVCRTVTLKL